MLIMDTSHPLTKVQKVETLIEQIFEILLKTDYVKMILVWLKVQGHSCNAKLKCRYYQVE